MTRFLRTLVVMLGMMSWIGPAEAQTYVRPSKGKAFTIVLAANTASATYDWTSFEALQLRATTASCVAGSSLSVYGNYTGGTISPTAANLVDDPNSTISRSVLVAGANFTLSNLTPYITFYTTSAGACTTTISVTPIPFNLRHTVNGPTNVSYVSTSSGTVTVAPVAVSGLDTVTGLPLPITAATMTGTAGEELHGLNTQTMPILATSTQSLIVPIAATCTAAITVHNFASIQNMAAVAVYCGTDAACTNTPTKVSAALQASIVANDGTGGSASFLNTAGTVYCVSAAGSANVAVNGY